MHQASKKGDLKKVKEVVSKNRKLIFGRDQLGRSPLHLAGMGGHTDVVRFLLSEDAETTKLFDNVSIFSKLFYIAFVYLIVSLIHKSLKVLLFR